MPAHHRTRRLALALALVGACLATASAAAAPLALPPGTWCGGTLWRLMTLSDSQRGSVDLHGVDTSIAQIARLTAPRRTPHSRATQYQRRVWRLRTVIDRYRIASNGEIVLILFSIDTNQYMDAYMPNPGCLGRDSRDRTGMISARRQLTDRCPPVTAAWQLLGITVEIGGVGFWNPKHTTRGALESGAELRPVTNFRIVNGCGIG